MRLRQSRGWLVRLFGLFHRTRREREFAEELESHLALHIEDNLRAGLSPEEARRRALVKLGGVTLTQELHREQGGLPMLETLMQDLRFGLRMLRKNPGFSLIAILTLALGIGANTAIFSLANALLLRSLPVPEPQGLVTIGRGDGLGEPLSYPDFVALRERNEVLAGLAAVHFGEVSWGNGSRSEVLRGELVSSDYLDVLGVRPLLGRSFAPEEERSPQPVVILSHAFWQSRFSSNPNLVGQTITLHRQPYTVIGIAPAGFNGMVEMFRTDLWLPLSMLPQARPMFRESLATRHDQIFAAIGRLKSGVALTQAQTALETINQQLELAEPPPASRQHWAPDVWFICDGAGSNVSVERISGTGAGSDAGAGRSGFAEAVGRIGGADQSAVASLRTRFRRYSVKAHIGNGLNRLSMKR